MSNNLTVSLCGIKINLIIYWTTNWFLQTLFNEKMSISAKRVPTLTECTSDEFDTNGYKFQWVFTLGRYYSKEFILSSADFNVR